MARNSNKPWTEEDNAKLRALASQKASLMKATAAMHRSQFSVRRRAQDLGLTFLSPTQERQRIYAAMAASS